MTDVEFTNRNVKENYACYDLILSGDYKLSIKIYVSLGLDELKI